jgi:hypothetical protein
MNPLELLVLAAASRIPDGKHSSSSLVGLAAASSVTVKDPDRTPRSLVGRVTP